MVRILELEPDHIFMTAEIAQLAGGCLDDADFFNEVALDIAAKYQSRELNFTICDKLVNELHRAVIEGLLFSGASMPEPFWSVFLAFDAGEFYLTADKSDDPVAEQTDPQIAEILRQHARNRIAEN